MSSFVYKAVDRYGKEIKGKLEAPNKEAVEAILKAKGTYVVSVDEESIFNSNINLNLNATVTNKKMALFSRQFTMLLKAGISISAALDILREQLDDKIMIGIADQLYQDVQKGISLSEAMKNTGKLPDLFINTVAAGEAGGFLDEVMERMATYYEKESKLTSKVQSALIYPCMVLLVTIVVVYILVTKVVPEFAKMFADMGVELPFLTRLLMSVGNFFIENWAWVFGGLGLVIALLVAYLKTPSGKMNKDVLLINIPLVKDIILKSTVARFARTFSIMLKSGVQMINALELSASIISNKVITKGLESVRNDVSTGNSLAGPIENLKLFPKMVVTMIKIGEETGALDEMMMKCAEFYDEEVDTLTTRITSLIEPMIIIILAGVVGTVVMAVIQPMFQMYTELAV